MGEMISRNKRAFFGAAVVLFTSLVMVIGAAASSSAQSADITVDAGTYTIPDPDGTVEASVRIDPKGSNLGAVAVVISYDQALVKPLTCTAVSGVGACNFEVAGEVRFDAVRAEGWPNAFNATKIEFQALGKLGKTTLGVEVREAYNVDLGTLSGQGIAGSITITAGSPSAKLESSCLLENGKFQVTYDNPTDAAVTFTTTVTGLATRTKSVAAGAVDKEIVTGRPDGDYTVTVTANGTQILRSDETVKCDPPPQEVRIKNSCLASNGRIDIYLQNTTSAAQTYSVAVGSLTPRVVQIAAGAQNRITVTGRPDGDIPVVVKRGSTTVSNTTVTVDCDVDQEVLITNSCLMENGRIDTTLMNLTSKTSTYAVKVGNLSPRSRVLPAGESVTVTVTGRPDGTLPVVVTRDGAEVASRSVTVACDQKPGPDKEVVVSVSCLAGNGRIDVLLGNTQSASANYKVEVGDLAPRFRTVASKATDKVTVTGRPDGPIPVVVSRGTTQIHTSTETVACG